jgi:hypothetical protein
MSYTFTDVIPNVDPSGVTLTNPGLGVTATRFFKFYFDTLADTSSCTVRMSHSSSANNQERIISIYQDGVGVNLINSTNVATVSGNTSISADNIIITSSSVRTDFEAFTISNLLPNTRYYIITRTTNNTTATTPSADVELALLNNGTSIQLPLTYAETGTININNVFYYYTGVIPNIDAS